MLPSEYSGETMKHTQAWRMMAAVLVAFAIALAMSRFLPSPSPDPKPKVEAPLVIDAPPGAAAARANGVRMVPPVQRPSSIRALQPNVSRTGYVDGVAEDPRQTARDIVTQARPYCHQLAVSLNNSTVGRTEREAFAIGFCQGLEFYQ